MFYCLYSNSYYKLHIILTINLNELILWFVIGFIILDMNIIIENPFRVLGVFADASQKEIVKNHTRLTKYASINQTFPLITDFSFLPEIQKDKEYLLAAINKIGQSKDKINYALFWFVNFNNFDDIALKYLERGDVEEAIEIWKKVIGNNNITLRSYSAFFNLSTLYIEYGIYKNSKNLICEGIQLKSKFVNSEYLSLFITKIAGDNIILDLNYVATIFCDTLNLFIENTLIDISFNELLGLLSILPDDVLSNLKKNKVRIPIQEINDEIDFCIEKRVDNSLAYDAGINLYNNVRKQLVFLRNTLGSSSIQIDNLRNHIANEILKCATDFYNYWMAKDVDKGKEALFLTKRALRVNPSGSVLNTINDNIKTLKERIEIAKKNEKEQLTFGRIKNAVENITEAISIINSSSKTIIKTDTFLEKCRPSLVTIKDNIEREEYIKFSSVVANTAMESLVEIVNTANSTFELFNNIETLYKSIFSANETLSKIALIEMDFNIKQRYNENKSSLKTLLSQVRNMKSAIDTIPITTRKPTPNYSTSSRQSSSSNSNSSGGCYIATMAYGDYDHPQVLELRKFRDDVLAQSFFGRMFIKIYYATSPHLVKLLKGHEKINKYIRNRLDKFIDKLNK